MIQAIALEVNSFFKQLLKSFDRLPCLEIRSYTHSMKPKMKLGLIGCGRMGSAILTGALERGLFKASEVCVHNRTEASAKLLAKKTGIHLAASNQEVAEISDLVLLGCKPQQVSDVLHEISPALPGNTVIISLAAGITLATMESATPEGTRIIRSMPNTPCMINKGATGITAGSFATQANMEAVSSLFDAVGIVEEVEEHQLDALTALSGSGPAYVYQFVQSLSEQATKEGLPEKQALQLAIQTVLGAAKMLSATGQPPQQLIDQVTSPGGTTLAGLAALTEHGFEKSIAAGIHAAAERSREIAQEAP